MVRRSSAGRRWCLGLAMVGVVLAASGPAASAASPSALPSASERPPEIGIESWLDAPLTPDAPAGRSLDIGVTLWDAHLQQLPRVSGTYIKLYPATGHAKPSAGEARADWPGHLRARLPVPKGGPGVVEVGLRGSQCDGNGTCIQADFPFVNGGIGPPPDARRSTLVIASMRDLGQPIVVGKPFTITVDLAPRADWDPTSLGLPDRLQATVAHPRGPDLTQADLRASQPADGSYTGTITVPEGGDIVITAAIRVNGSEDDVLPGATTRVNLAGAPTVAPSGPTVAVEETGIPLPVILAIAAFLVVAGWLIVRRVFADL